LQHFQVVIDFLMHNSGWICILFIGQWDFDTMSYRLFWEQKRIVFW